MKKLICISLLFLSLAQGELYAQKYEKSKYVTGLFKGTRIINGHNTEYLREGEMEFIISHRFGRVNGGVYELFGLDQSTIRLGLDYGIKDWLLVGVGRSSFEKTLDAFTKVRFLRQKKSGLPFSMSYLGTVAHRGLKETDPVQDHFYSSRLFFTHQLLFSSKIGDRLSLQIMPTYLHRNFVDQSTGANDIYSMGVAGRYKVNKNFAITGEYYYALPNRLGPTYTNALSLGVEIETSGHVFQIHLSNSRGMVEKFFIGETTGKWSQGDIHLGFNMSRIFKLKGRWY